MNVSIPFVLLAAPVLVALGWMAVMQASFTTWHRRAGLRLRRLGLFEHLEVWAAELWAFAKIAVWHVRAFFADGPRFPARVAGRPVLLVHGFTQNGTNWWGLRRHLEAHGRPTVAFSMGRPLRSVATHARRAAGQLRALAAAHPDGIDVVAHSMGGIVLRQVLAEHPDLAPCVRRIVTLGSPHRGTASARFAPRGWRVDISQLALGSPFLAHLPDLAEVAPTARITTVAAERDLVVYPNSSCHVARADHVVLQGLGHAGLLTHPLAHDTVSRALTDASERRVAK